MLELSLKLLFALFAIIYISMTVYGKLFVFRKKKPQFVSDYCATMGGMIFIYSLISLAIVFIVPTLLIKLVFLGFALMPFFFGLISTYHTEKYLTVLQTLVMVYSIYYVI